MTNYRPAIILTILLVITLAFGLFFHNPYSYSNKQTIANPRYNSLTKIDNSNLSLRGYYDQAQQLGQDTPGSASVTFLAAGDIMLSRNVAAAIQKANNNVDLPFQNMTDTLKSTDFNFANLESPVAPATPIVGGTAMIFAAPPAAIKGLSDFNFKILNLANNHAFDQGLAGVDATRKILDQSNIAHEGTGDTLEEAWAPAVVTANGLQICFIGASYASVNDNGTATNNYIARMEDLPRLKTAIVAARQECDFVVTTMHGGVEYTRTPNSLQTQFAHAAINDGADIVIGAHPHWVQTVEKYNGKYIFYSLGNFVFDQDFSQETMEGLTLKITISKNKTVNTAAPGAATMEDLQGTRQPAELESIELIPIIVSNSQPRPANTAETNNILKQVGQKSNLLK